MSTDAECLARLGGRTLETIDPYNCPTCGRRVLGRALHEGTGPCKACTNTEDPPREA